MVFRAIINRIIRGLFILRRRLCDYQDDSSGVEQFGIPITKEIAKQYPPKIIEAWDTFDAWWYKKFDGASSVSKSSMPAEVRAAFRTISKAPIPGYDGKTGKDSCYVRGVNEYLVDIDDPYLYFAKLIAGRCTFYVSPNTRKEGFRNSINKALRHLKEHDDWNFYFAGEPYTNEHLYEIVRLYCGFDSRPISHSKKSHDL